MQSLMHSLETWAWSCPAQEHKPHHPDAHALPWHHHETETCMLPNSQSLPNPWPRLNTQNTMSNKVCWSFSGYSDSFNASTRPTNPVTSTTTFEARHASTSTVLHPKNTNFLFPFSNKVSNVTISRKRQVVILPANLPAQYRRGRVPPKEQQQTGEGTERALKAH